ncbi:MAG: uncharacterized protein KVP18_004376 [Porospora cf. gigantea A]|uniref:uncharacterized protein n=1 Tax=Porospora cf. gigantea A TaxID=2853593 RepID=UPI003559E858|nr:MAG: hypothetical protein KVP18_004376 [Porospora cf. gigantea A]
MSCSAPPAHMVNVSMGGVPDVRYNATPVEYSKPEHASLSHTFGAQPGYAYESVPYEGYTHAVTTANPGYDTYGTTASRMSSTVLPSGAVEQSSRRISSTIIGEEMIGTMPQPKVTYVDVPMYEEVVTHVPVREVREIEKKIPKVEVQYVEKIVDVPQIEYVNKTVEVQQVQEVIRHVPRVEYVDRPYDVVKEIPRLETKIVEKIIEIPEVIEVPKPFVVEQKIPVARYNDSEQALIVAQSVHPLITSTSEYVEVDAVELCPEVVPVDVHVGKLVNVQLIQGGALNTRHRVVTVPSAQYNSMLKYLNGHLYGQEVQNLPYLQEGGQIPFLSETFNWVGVPATTNIEGYAVGQAYAPGIRVSNAAGMRTEYSNQVFQGSGAQGEAIYTGGYSAAHVGYPPTTYATTGHPQPGYIAGHTMTQSYGAEAAYGRTTMSSQHSYQQSPPTQRHIANQVVPGHLNSKLAYPGTLGQTMQSVHQPSQSYGLRT